MINNAFQLSIQHGRTPPSSMMNKTHRSPFPALNVKRRSKHAATDTVYCDTPAIDNGSTCAQLLVGQIFFFDSESFRDHDLDESIQNVISYNNVTTNSNKPEH